MRQTSGVTPGKSMIVNRGLPEMSYCRLADSVVEEGAFAEEVRRDVAPGGGVGAAIPAVCEPSPSRCNVGASSLPLTFSPCDAWNLRIAAAVSSSHLPVGGPVNDPPRASAV